jgi:hypothetical protein
LILGRRFFGFLGWVPWLGSLAGFLGWVPWLGSLAGSFGFLVWFWCRSRPRDEEELAHSLNLKTKSKRTKEQVVSSGFPLQNATRNRFFFTDLKALWRSPWWQAFHQEQPVVLHCSRHWLKRKTRVLHAILLRFKTFAWILESR